MIACQGHPERYRTVLECQHRLEPQKLELHASERPAQLGSQRTQTSQRRPKQENEQYQVLESQNQKLHASERPVQLWSQRTQTSQRRSKQENAIDAMSDDSGATTKEQGGSCFED